MTNNLMTAPPSTCVKDPPVIWENIPQEPRVYKNWVIYRIKIKDGKLIKVPYQPNGKKADVADCETWNNFETVCEAFQKGNFAGIGYVFSEDDPFCGIDLDHSVNDGKLFNKTQNIIDSFNSCTEFSPSGEGVHIIVKGKKPGRDCRKPGIEVYDHGRFFTFTGNHLPGTPLTIEERQEELNKFHFDTFGKPVKSAPKEIPSDSKKLCLSDEELLKKAMNAINGAIFEKLLAGEWEGYYPSHSEADLAFCRRLAFHSQKNAIQMDRIVRRSGLMRDKWDEKRGEKTWGQIYCIEKAIATVNEFYKGNGNEVTPDDFERFLQKKFSKEGEKIRFTDLGNCRRFVLQYQGKVHYSESLGWLTWDEKHWIKDNTGQVMSFAKQTVKNLFQEVEGLQERAKKIDEQIKKVKDEKVIEKLEKLEEQKANIKGIADSLQKFAIKSQEKGKIQAIVTLAKSEPEIAITDREFDKDPWLLNCQNGTLNIKTGELKSHDPKDLITKIINIPYLPGATCPTFISFLDKIFKGDQEIIAFIQRAIGYSLTGSTKEQVLFFLYGVGRNGKSTFIGAISLLLNDYSRKTSADTLMVKHFDNAISNDLARLRGSRLVVSSELPENKQLSESIIKDLTGGDIITARFLHKEFFEFIPNFKLWMYGNHKPIIRGTDEGIWRRIILIIPFDVVIPKDECDPDLPEKLREELPGVLSWAVKGCLAWEREGLNPPGEVSAATSDYRSEQDQLGNFLEDHCIIDKNLASQVPAGQLFNLYRRWCESSNEKRVLTHRAFSQCMRQRGFWAKKREGGTGRFCYTGIEIKN